MIIKAKKSLGQNFLVDKKIIEKITSITDIENKTIMEVGPGTGNLTESILKKNIKKIYLVEKDNNLCFNLKKKFNNKVNLINDDILNIDEKNIDPEKLIVFGNLPYNISTEILTRWIINLDNKKFWFDYLILMFQKEVADRIIAQFNKSEYGRLSIISNWRLHIKKIFEISPESFYPKPKIKSTLLFFKPKKIFYNFNDTRNLEKVTRVFFNHRRKMLKKPFNQLFNGNNEVAEKLNINLNLRPQNLNFDDYYKITQEFEKLRN